MIRDEYFLGILTRGYAGDMQRCLKDRKGWP